MVLLTGRSSCQALKPHAARGQPDPLRKSCAPFCKRQRKTMLFHVVPADVPLDATCSCSMFAEVWRDLMSRGACAPCIHSKCACLEMAAPHRSMQKGTRDSAVLPFGQAYWSRLPLGLLDAVHGLPSQAAVFGVLASEVRQHRTAHSSEVASLKGVRVERSACWALAQ